MPSATLVNLRSLPTEPIETVFASDATELAPKATELAPLACELAPNAVAPSAVACAFVP